MNFLILFKKVNNSSLLRTEKELYRIPFYKSLDGHLGRTKNRVNKSGITCDSTSIKTHATMNDFFKQSSKEVFLRNSFGNLLRLSKVSNKSNHLLETLSKVKNLDLSSIRVFSIVNQKIDFVIKQELNLKPLYHG